MRDRTSHLTRSLHAISHSSNDAIVSINAQGIIQTWNPAAERIFQFSEAEAVGRPLDLIIPKRFQEGHDAGVKRAAGGGPFHVIGKTVELAGLRRNGEEFPLELSLSTWDAEGERFFAGIIRDISERKKSEAAMLESEARFRSITETANDAIISADGRGRVISWNRAAEEMFGHTALEVQGKSLSLIVPERFRAHHEAGMQRVAGGGERHVIGKTVELFGLHKDGNEFPIELSLSTWQLDGGAYFCGIIRDISERKKSEAALEKSKEKLKAKAMKLKSAHKELHEKNSQLEALSNKLAKYLSRQVYDSIFHGKRDVKIESYRKKLTVFFSDIHNFAELTDRVESEVLTKLLNRYLNEMSKIAIEYGGTIDKYIGDAIMIFFGDPDSLGEREDATACVKMAIAMQEKLSELQREWEVLGLGMPLEVRMGINTGYCTVGNFGSEERLDYTIVGSQVNLASRLEGAARENHILISEETYGLIKEHIFCEKKEKIKVKGMAYPVQTYEVIGLYEELKKQRERLKKELTGFRLQIDFDKLSYADKLAAREILEKALCHLGVEEMALYM
ncbi:MAG: PAS domain S-box protein, partial [Saprospiraceae bacterium]|nr:PAS domain S-box protein [Saprospiraceae bacterium]